MSTSYRLTTEMFAIPYDGDTYILYSPLKQLLLLANGAMVDLLAELRAGTFAEVTGENLDAMQLLVEAGAVNGVPDEPPRHRVATPWKPTEVTLFLTNACNLRCSYCYASAGDYKGALEPRIAIAAVELVARNAAELGQRGFRVSYHGGGEPTLAWDALRASAERAEELGRSTGLEVSRNLATNGVLPSWKVDWLVRHIDEFSISYDGPGELQDTHRPAVNGRGSAETVEATFRHLDSHAAKYGIRATITRDSVDRMAEIVGYILERFSPGVIHVEPVYSQGRARERGLGAPDADVFIRRFREAQAVAESHGMDLYYSGARSELITDTFCGVPDGSFNVTPEGLLTSCFEVCHPEDEFAGQFFYGGAVDRQAEPQDASSLSPTSGRPLLRLPIIRDEPAPRPTAPRREFGGFAIDERQLETLASFTVHKRPECQNCFCKWHCAGDCIAKNMISDRHPGESLKAARCTINQALTRDQLLRRLQAGSRMARQMDATGISPIS